ncbi:uncharacterized protein LOC124892514 [Capsicum annuum]|uniref:uncharacterized protein LOC124892514 n=1 Tax=Capsicum annuum TaxID=4072 RepID=UPI001FB06F0C|nr:uncharacterized protein LOC124892514 [Capsicum annuum]
MLKKILANQTQFAAELKNLQVATRSLEFQVGQNQKTLNTRPQGGLLADIETPKQVMAITLRSGKELEGKPPKAIKKADAHVVTQNVDNKVAENSRKSEYLNEKVAEPEVKQMPPLPFSQRHIKAKEDTLFKKFIDTFKELHIKLPLLDILHSTPKYAKYLRDMVAKKVKLQDMGAITLTEEFSAVMK